MRLDMLIQQWLQSMNRPSCHHLFLGRKFPQLKAFEQMPLVFDENARDCGETPVLIWFMKLGRLDACRMKFFTQPFKANLIANRQVDITGMMVGGATKLIGVFKGGVTSLNRLLREWDVAARDCIEIGFADLLLRHDISFQVFTGK